ncbi:helix-turn-helix transcriptional regulator [Nocardia mexicana]|uniref:Regulatory LuxR family protein n=1 Tax=Nocardia mexicana TaxID=279262 RepID=A0A370GNE7_9NOCA|nr:AAA family ATPase [Nocardia mexicana]RDI45245.1 regulatory LuxR family protein [Nocardia mexicana]
MLLGRDRELRAIRKLIDDARGGDAGIMALRAEAGMGKTAFLDAARDMADGMTVLECSGVEFESGLAFSGLHQLLLPILDAVDLLPDGQSVALRNGLGLADGNSTDLAVCAATLSLLALASEQRPLLILVDDVQWLDGSSREALMFTARRLLADPIAMLLAVRDPSEVDTSFLPELRLGGLDRADAARLLDQAGWESSDIVRDALIEATTGNPLALIELSRTGASGQLALDLMLRGTVPLSLRLQEAFVRRVDLLPADSRLLALVVAAEASADTGLLLRAAARLGVPDAALAPIEESGTVRVVGPHVTASHPLIRSAVYQRASFHDRARVHAALAAELAERGDRLRSAHHRVLAADAPDDALAAELEQLGDEVIRRGGAAAAAQTMQWAAQLSSDADDARRRRTEAAYAAWRSGQADMARSIIDQIGRDHADSTDVVAARLGRLHGLIETDDGDPVLAYAQLFRSGDVMATVLPDEAMWLLFLAVDAASISGDLEGQLAAARRMVALDIEEALRTAGGGLLAVVAGTSAPETTDPHRVFAAIRGVLPFGDPRPQMLAMAIGTLGYDWRPAREFGIELCKELRALGMTNVLTIILNWVADIEYHIGLWHQGVSHAEESARLAQHCGQRSRRATALGLLARFAAVMGDEHGCLEHVEQTMALASPLGNRTATALAQWSRGLNDLARRNPDAAVESLLRVAAADSPHSNQLTARAAMADLMEAAYYCGGDERVRTAFEDFERWAAASEIPWVTVQLDRCRTFAHWEFDEEHARRVLDDPAIGHLPFEHARAHLTYGGWLRRNRRPVEAREHLRTATELFGSVGATVWRANAVTELRAAGGSAEPPASDVSMLTPQELHVAHLAAKGFSNKEIAAEMFISPRTVGYHLYKIFPKLGIASRSDLRRIGSFARDVPLAERP